MRKAAIVVFFLAAAFTRPVSVLRVTSMFGESRGDHFHNGMDFAGDGDPVRAVLSGTLLFSWDEEDFPDEEALGYGNFVILQHGDKYRSHYYHLRKGSIPRNLVAVSEGHVIGLAGNSGHSGGPHLHFTIVDTKEKKILNPIVFLPEFSDTGRPVIGGVYYAEDPRPGYGFHGLREIGKHTVLTQGRKVWLFVQSWDTVQTTRLKAGVYRLEVRVQGGALCRYRFDSLDLVPPEGTLLDARWRFEEVFAGPYLYRAGSFTVGQEGAVRLEILAGDYHANEERLALEVRTALPLREGN